MRGVGITALAWIAAAMAGAVGPAAAQGYPARPVRIIVPTSPPGGADVVARLIAPGLSERLGQQVVVDNRAGASTMIGENWPRKRRPTATRC